MLNKKKKEKKESPVYINTSKVYVVQSEKERKINIVKNTKTTPGYRESRGI